MQTIKLEIINNAIDVMEMCGVLAGQGFNVECKAVGPTATITATRFFDGEPEVDDTPTTH